MRAGEQQREPVTRPGVVNAYVALGANLGDAVAALRQAVEAMNRMPLTQVRQSSGLYKTAPLDTDSGSEARAPGGDYFNAVVALETGLTAPALLDQLQQIEQQAGRQRPYRNAPRTLDLDLLLYGDQRIATPQLSVPHPRMHQRAFVLRPLFDVAPEAVIPGLGSVADWLPGVADQSIEKASP